MIVDKPSMKVVSASVGMYDLMERQVSLVEPLQKKRAPFKDMAAIYILSPTQKSLDRMLADWQDKNNLKYGDSVFVFFLGTIPQSFVEAIMNTRQLVKRLKALSELNVDFLVKEDRAFSLDIDAPFSAYYADSTKVERKMADKLVSLCASLNEYPYIRFNKASPVCTTLAQTFKKKMDRFVAANPEWWYHGSGGSGKKSTELERSTLLLLDRATDCLTPLMHDFTYQPMVQDLLKIDGDQITCKVEGKNPDKLESKDVLLNDKDKLWVELRGKHIAQVIEILSARISETVNSSSGNALAGDKNVSLSDLASALKELPEYRELMAKLSQHMHISHECMDTFTQTGLMDLSELEQCLATRETDEGGKIETEELIAMVEDTLIRMKDKKAKLRLLLIATLTLGDFGGNRMKKAARLSNDDMYTVDSLAHLAGYNLGADFQTKKKRGGFFSALRGGDDDEEEYASSRYKPALKSILTDLVTNTLDIEAYPSIVPMPASAAPTGRSARSARSARPAVKNARRTKGLSDKWGRTGSPTSSGPVNISFTGARSMVFMVGGLSYSELRVAEKVMEKESKEIIMGSSTFLSPKDFIKCIETLN